MFEIVDFVDAVVFGPFVVAPCVGFVVVDNKGALDRG